MSTLVSAAKLTFKTLLSIPPEERHFAFAKIFVPGVVLFMAGLIFFGYGPADDGEEVLTLVAIRSVSGSDGLLKESHGALAIVELSDHDIALLFEEVPDPLLVYSSLTTEEISANTGSLIVDANHVLRLKPPIYASSPTTSFTLNRKIVRVMVDGRPVSPAAFGPQSRRAGSVTVFALLGAVFCFGLTFSLRPPGLELRTTADI